jgi:peptidoglycan/LPS O-acetylase OafA/YrhL
LSATTAGAIPPTYQASAEAEDITGTDFGRKPVLWTTVIITGAAVLGNAVLWVGSVTDSTDKVVFWAPVFAIVVSVVGLVSFGGFYAAARRARVAITASVVTTFIVMMVFSLTISALNDSANAELAKSLIGDFRTIVITVVGFYFGTETVLTVTKILATRGADPGLRQTLGRVDRDLPTIG